MAKHPKKKKSAKKKAAPVPKKPVKPKPLYLMTYDEAMDELLAPKPKTEPPPQLPGR